MRLFLGILLSLFFLSACKNLADKDKIAPQYNLDRKDYDQEFLSTDNKSIFPSIATDHYDMPLDLAPLVEQPDSADTLADKRVSISVNEDTPVKEIFIEIGRLADINMEIDPNIKGSVIFRAKDQPVNTVLQRICDMTNLKYTNQNGLIRVEEDLPYVEYYALDFLNMTRDNTSAVQTSTSIGGTSSSGSSSGGSSSSSGSGSSGSSSGSSSNSGSSLNMTTKNSYDIWQTVEENINSILNSKKTTSTKGNNDTNVNVSVNKPAGVISVFATQKQHKQVATYVNNIKRSLSAQVLIEAKILEVSLDKEYHAGINWTMINKNFQSKGGFMALNDINDNAKDLSVGIISHPLNLSAALAFTEKFGVANILATPRLLVLNNQQAVLSFTDNKVYFTVAVAANNTIGSAGQLAQNTFNVSSTLNTVPIGTVLVLQPVIDINTQEITMNIRPTITRSDNSVTDPASAYLASQIQLQNPNSNVNLTSTVPIVTVRELDSVVKIRSGDVIVLGGMIDKSVTNRDQGIPFVSDVPVAGNLFKMVDKAANVVETVILLQATITNNKNSVSHHDRSFYNKFSGDSSNNR